MTKKKIIIINQYGVTPDFPGATKHYDMANYFSTKELYEVEYWLSGLNHKTNKNHESLKGIRLQSSEQINKSFKIVKIKGFSYGGNLILRQLSIILFEIITSIKIIFSKDIKYIVLNTPPVGIISVLSAKLRNKKLIIDVEDLWPLFLQDMGLKNKFAINYMSFCAKSAYELANKISTVSQGMFDYVENIRNTNSNMWIAPLGINMSEFSNVEKDYSLIENKNWKNDFKIVYLGAHGRANDLKSVLDTIKDFETKFPKKINGQKISFIFIGDGDQKDDIIKYKEELQIKTAYFEDSVPGNMVPKYLVHADICLTNLQKIESFKLVRPNKLFQYMALGKPIITGIWGEFKQIVEKENAGIYVDFTDYENASEMIYKFIDNKEKLKEMSKNGINYVKNYGDRNKIFEDYLLKMEEN